MKGRYMIVVSHHKGRLKAQSRPQHIHSFSGRWLSKGDRMSINGVKLELRHKQVEFGKSELVVVFYGDFGIQEQPQNKLEAIKQSLEELDYEFL